MQTNFTEHQLKDKGTQRANQILRSCVHCGFCTATCPTYQLLGDELDSPRGRIYQIKDMLENERIPDAKTVMHIDRCLSCLACMTTCPSGVHYMHLVDHARAYIEKHHKRRFDDRALRWILSKIIPYPNRFRLALAGAKLARPFRRYIPDKRMKAMLEMASAPIHPPSESSTPTVFPAKGARLKRVALMTGCAQQVLDSDINKATIAFLTRHGIEVVIAKGAGCCGALTHHMGKEKQSHASAIANVQAWQNEIDGEGLDAIIINTSGCGTTVKDYGHMLSQEAPHIAKAAENVAHLAKDISEFASSLELKALRDLSDIKVAYHAACSLQHGQKIVSEPKILLKKMGFEVLEPKEGHLCCGSAGTYNLLQPELAGQLRTRKVQNIEATQPDIIAAGNIGCMKQIGGGTQIPIVHTIELLNWATGGEKPAKLSSAY